MNLDEMLAASGISGGAAAVNGNTKSGFVTFVGRPNVGKSTLMNRLIGQKIAITSNKPQTTRNKIQTVFTDERGQIVFVDTPGIHKAKNKLGEYMVGAAEKTIGEVDVICWLVEPTTFIGAGEQHIIEKLKKVKRLLPFRARATRNAGSCGTICILQRSWAPGSARSTGMTPPFRSRNTLKSAGSPRSCWAAVPRNAAPSWAPRV